MLTQREANKVFLFFPMAKTDFFCKGGPWLICLSPKYATELLMPEDQNQKIWMRGNRLNCWCPRSETKRSEWGGTGWTVDARGTKPKDLNEGEQVELLMPEERNQKIWMRGEQVELLMLEERNQKIWMRGEQIELLMPEEQNQKIWMRENRLNCWCPRIKTKRSEWGGTDWTVDARGSKPKDLNSGINSSTCSPSFKTKRSEWGRTGWTVDARGSKPKDLNEGEQVELLMPEERNQKIWMRENRLNCWCPRQQQFNLIPLNQIFWFWFSGINRLNLLMLEERNQKIWSSRGEQIEPVDALRSKTKRSESRASTGWTCWCLRIKTKRSDPRGINRLNLLMPSGSKPKDLILRHQQVEPVDARESKPKVLLLEGSTGWICWSPRIKTKRSEWGFDPRASTVEPVDALRIKTKSFDESRHQQVEPVDAREIKTKRSDPRGINRLNLLMPSGTKPKDLNLRHQQIEPVDAWGAKPKDLLLEGSTGWICWCPRIRTKRFESSGINRLNLLMPSGARTKRSEWGRTGWTVDARGTKPKDLNEGGTGWTCWCPQERNRKFWSSRGEQIEPVDARRFKTKRSWWGGTGWTVDARESKPKDLNGGEQIELLMPQERNQKIWMRENRLKRRSGVFRIS